MKFEYLNSILGAGNKLLTVDNVDLSKDNWYEVNFLVLKPESLAKKYRNEKYQLALCTGGFGCNPINSGRMVSCVFLDGDYSAYGRDNYYGAASKETIEYWFKKYHSEISWTSEHFLEAINKEVA